MIIFNHIITFFKNINVPVALHVDHGSYEDALNAIENGFSSVMFDGSKYGIEENLDDIVADILCTSSVRAVREIEPKLVVAMGNVDGMVSELKLTARTEKKLKVKNLDSLPSVREVVVLN